MREMIIQDKNGSNKEVIRLSNYAFNDVIKYAREKALQEQEGDAEGLSCLFG